MAPHLEKERLEALLGGEMADILSTLTSGSTEEIIGLTSPINDLAPLLGKDALIELLEIVDVSPSLPSWASNALLYQAASRFPGESDDLVVEKALRKDRFGRLGCLRELAPLLPRQLMGVALEEESLCAFQAAILRSCACSAPRQMLPAILDRALAFSDSHHLAFVFEGLASRLDEALLGLVLERYNRLADDIERALCCNSLDCSARDEKRAARVRNALLRDATMPSKSWIWTRQRALLALLGRPLGGQLDDLIEHEASIITWLGRPPPPEVFEALLPWMGAHGAHQARRWRIWGDMGLLMRKEEERRRKLGSHDSPGIGDRLFRALSRWPQQMGATAPVIRDLCPRSDRDHEGCGGPKTIDDLRLSTAPRDVLESLRQILPSLEPGERTSFVAGLARVNPYLLAALIPHVAREELAGVCSTAFSTLESPEMCSGPHPDEEHLVAMASLLGYLPAHERPGRAAELLNGPVSRLLESNRTSTITLLLPHLDADLREEALRQAVAGVECETYSFNCGGAMASLVGHISPQEARRLADHIAGVNLAGAPDRCYSRALGDAIKAGVSQQTLYRILCEVGDLDNTPWCHREMVIDAALGAALNDDAFPLPVLLPLWQAMLRRLSRRERQEVLVDLSVMGPCLAALGGPDAREQVCGVVEEIASWWP